MAKLEKILIELLEDGPMATHEIKKALNWEYSGYQIGATIQQSNRIHIKEKLQRGTLYEVE